uniref:NAD(P)-binding domain-containing protein n=1 Tax=Mantoniella antarctica TaxID=81844 RepID=A0A7S0SAF6_9CHLO|mmetsp:Transcript_10971/g.17607  ORF Transcript_10971/g.17607 Transcript_10971/m.17607 type:complete len:235 (+) Transcript_10971:40-744(+)
MAVRKVCIIGASGKLGRYMVQHCLDRGLQVVAVCRVKSASKLDDFRDKIVVVPGPTNDEDVVGRAVAGCDGVLTVLAPWGRQQYSSGTARAVITHAEPGARLIFSCGWHVTKDGKDQYSWGLRALVVFARCIGWLTRLLELEDQDEACRRIFASDTQWTVVRGCDLEEGPSQGLPVWSRHVGDPILASNCVRRVDFAQFMVAALDDATLVREAPAINGCASESALSHASAAGHG